jgi:hypothetical protein
MSINPEELYHVLISEEGISCEHPEREKESIKWSDIREVEVKTTDEGPFLPDVWFIFKGDQSSCSIPQGADGFDLDTAFSVFGRFEGFDYDTFTSSMSCSENKSFSCWRALR